MPLLGDGLTSQSFEVRRIADPYLSNITFSPEGRFFIVEGSAILKFDAAGRETFRLEQGEDMYRPPFSPFVVASNGVYDFREDLPERQPIVQYVNNTSGKTFTEESFARIFGQAYADADIVLIGKNVHGTGRMSTYLRIGGKWVLFYVAYSNIDIEEDFELGNRIKNFEAKTPRMIMLKDEATGKYAHDSRRLRSDKVQLPEDALDYTGNQFLETISYDSTYISESFAYTPIPALWGGVGHYRLSVEGQAMEFWEIAVREVMSAKVSTKLNLFGLPSPYNDDVPVRFLEFLLATTLIPPEVMGCT